MFSPQSTAQEKNPPVKMRPGPLNLPEELKTALVSPSNFLRFGQMTAFQKIPLVSFERLGLE
jgi:hypothetical protein